jgi:GDPmannose 4,6-dehydratase
MMLQQPSAQGCIIATGQSHTLTEFVETAFNLIGKDWRDDVTTDQHHMRPTDIMRNKVDPSKAASFLGWKAKNGMKEVIGMMVESEMKNLCDEHSA